MREHAAQRFHAAFGTSLEEVADERFPLVLDLGFHGTPAREAVISRYGQLSTAELGLRISLPEFVQSILGQLSQVFERSPLGKL